MGEKRDDALKTFASRKGWYRGSEVDRLSEEEAGVIVDRLVRRAMVTEPTIGGKTNSLKPALLKVIREQLTRCTSTQCREDSHKKLTATPPGCHPPSHLFPPPPPPDRAH